MMNLCLLFTLCLGVSRAFTVDTSSRRTLSVRTPRADGSYDTHLFMFDNDNAPKPLESVDAPMTTAESTSSSSSNVVKDLNTGEVKEVKWVDPAMAANENPMNMGWWASALFVIMPAALLFNDLAKATNGAGFLPTDGVLGFFGRL